MKLNNYLLGVLSALAVFSAEAVNVATLNVAESSVKNAGGFTLWTNHWTCTEFPTAPRTDNGQSEFVVPSRTALDLNAWGGENSPFPENKNLVNAGNRTGQYSTLEQRTFYGKSLTLDGGQLITPNFSWYDETDPNFETGSSNCGFYTAYFANAGLILRSGLFSNNWYQNSNGNEILGGKVTVDCPEGRTVTFASGTIDTNETHTICYRFLGEVSGVKGHLSVVQKTEQTGCALVMTNAVKYFGDISVGGLKGRGYVDLNAARLRALTVTNGAAFRITGDLGGNTVGNLKVEDAVLEFPRAESAFTVTNSFVQTGTLTIDASALPVSGANGAQITLLTLAAAVTATFDPDLVTVRVPEGWSSFKQAKAIGLYRSQIDVPYDAANTTATLVDLTSLTAETWSKLDKPVGVALSSAITVPFHETLTLPVATFPAAMGVSAADFVDVSPRTYGLPMTSFTVSDADGVTTLTLVARPVVQADKTPGHTGYYYLMDNADIWSDGRVPHAGADYLMVDFVGTDNNLYDSKTTTARAFPGESLTLVNCEYYNMIRGFTVDLRLYNMNSTGNQGIYFLPGYTFGGKIFVDSSCKDYWPFKPNSNNTNPVELTAPFTSDRPINFRYCWSATPLGKIFFAADNSGLTGMLKINGGINSGKTWNQMHVVITNATGLGGPRPVRDPQGLFLTHFSKLVVNDDVVYDTANRHLFARAGLQVEVAEGKTFKFLNEFRVSSDGGASFETYIPQRCAVEKTGPGTFALASQILPCQGTSTGAATPNGTNDFVRVVEGGLQPLAANTFDNLIVAFSNNTSVVVDPTLAATADYGLRLLTKVPIFAEGGTVNIKLAQVPENLRAFTVHALTVPQATPDLTSVLQAEKVQVGGLSFKGTVQKETVTVGDIVCIRYSVTYRPSGFMVLFR